jgi:hypothetical protein
MAQLRAATSRNGGGRRIRRPRSATVLLGAASTGGPWSPEPPLDSKSVKVGFALRRCETGAGGLCATPLRLTSRRLDGLRCRLQSRGDLPPARPRRARGLGVRRAEDRRSALRLHRHARPEPADRALAPGSVALDRTAAVYSLDEVAAALTAAGFDVAVTGFDLGFMPVAGHTQADAGTLDLATWVRLLPRGQDAVSRDEGVARPVASTTQGGRKERRRREPRSLAGRTTPGRRDELRRGGAHLRPARVSERESGVAHALSFPPHTLASSTGRLSLT